MTTPEKKGFTIDSEDFLACYFQITEVINQRIYESEDVEKEYALQLMALSVIMNTSRKLVGCKHRIKRIRKLAAEVAKDLGPTEKPPMPPENLN